MIDLNELPPAESSDEVVVHSPSNSHNGSPPAMTNDPIMTNKRKRKSVNEMTQEEKERAHAQGKSYDQRRYTKMKTFQNSKNPKEREIAIKFFTTRKESKGRHFARIKERKQLGTTTKEDLDRTLRKKEANAKYHQLNKVKINGKRTVNKAKAKEKKMKIIHPVGGKDSSTQEHP